MKNFKVRILLLVIVLAFFVGLTSFYLIKTNRAFSNGANLILLPESIPLRKENERFYVYILLNSKVNKLTAVDAVVKFDKDILEALESSPFGIFPTYPEMGRKIDNNNGLVYLSAVNYNQTTQLFEEPFQGLNLYGRILFRVKKSLPTKIDFQFTPGGTNDSNLIEDKTGNDILLDQSQLEGTAVN